MDAPPGPPCLSIAQVASAYLSEAETRCTPLKISRGAIHCARGAVAWEPPLLENLWNITLAKVTQQFLGPNMKPSQGFLTPGDSKIKPKPTPWAG